MMIPILLAVVWLFLVLAEFYLPGAIMGIMGGCLLVASVVLFAMESEQAWMTVVFATSILVALVFVIRYAILWISHAKSNSSIYLRGDQEGFVASTFDHTLIGKRGVVSADLKPGGFIQIGEEIYPAISVEGYLQKETPIAVIGGEGQSLIVKKE